MDTRIDAIVFALLYFLHISVKDPDVLNRCKKRINYSFLCAAVIGLLVAFWGHTGWPGDGGPPFSGHHVLKETIEDTIDAEKKNLETYKTQLVQVEDLKQGLLSELNTYNIQFTIYNNLIILPETSIKSLEKGLLDTQAAVNDLSNKSDELLLKRNEVNQLLARTDEQISLTKLQVSEIKAGADIAEEALELNRRLKELLGVLTQKRKLIDKLFLFYSEVIEPVGEAKTKYLELADKFERTIYLKKKRGLLERKSPLTRLPWGQLDEDLKMTFAQFQKVLTKEFWSRELIFFTDSGALFKVSFILVFLVIQLVVFRLWTSLCRWIDISILIDRPFNRLAVCILRQSVFLIGSTLFLFVYIHAELFQTGSPVINVVFDILILWLFTRWCKHAVQLYAENNQQIPGNIIDALGLLVTFIRCFGLIYILLCWMLPEESTTLILCRLCFELILYGWMLYFWKKYDQQKPFITEESGTKSAVYISVLKFTTYFVILVGLILELVGYGLLGLFWYMSWGRSIVVLIWGAIIFSALREWNPKLFEVYDTDMDDVQTARSSIRWVMVHLAMIAWFGCLIVLMVLSWGGKQAILIGIYRFLKYPYQVGNMQFSLLGFIIAIFILLVTHGIASVGHHFFREKVLKESGMEEGLQDSITTITVYVIWAIGIILALNAIGFNATTLMVVLGALGIGLGFGLQAIFNNFISGIILLFERPIQVGDDIEINGIWATVKKINVRSTVVQTYDNASLIIPNSDLISSQVTNWSFKDKRLRRNISVGVAYGSDIALVRETLLEVAEKTPRVLKSPKPDVIFKDFGDSALIFILRIWTRVDYFYSVETDIRFMIDRLFREKNIVIAFPQRDVHIIPDKAEGK